MTEFEHSPPKKIIIHQLIRNSLTGFTEKHCIPDSGPSFWVKGILFKHFTFVDSDEIIHEDLKGTIHWDVLEFAKMPDYKNKLSRTDSNFESVVFNYENYELFNELAAWLKTQPIWEDKP